MDWYVYIARTDSGQHYTGVSNDVTARIAKHNSGKGAKFARMHSGLKLVFTSSAMTKSEALKREAEVKKWDRATKEKLIRGEITLNYWLMKTEPDTFGIDDLKKKGTDHWDGVRNYQARNNMQLMAVGDKVLIHHSGKTPGVAGIAKVAKEAYPDFTAWDKKGNYYDPKSSKEKPIWEMVDVEFMEKFKAEVPLSLIKTDKKLKDMVLVNNSRLSVQPVTKTEFDRIRALAG